MGYYTKFSIATQPTESARAVRHTIESIIGYDPLDGEEVKWYDVAEDIVTVSQRHPGVIITITGDGEEQGDQWVIHAHAGQTEHHKREPWQPPTPSEAMLGARDRADREPVG